VGLGTALNTMDSDEPTLGYGAAQPFAILANVLLISLFHSLFFI
jgi:putative transport protein